MSHCQWLSTKIGKNGWHNSQVLIHTYLAQKITFTGCAWLCYVFILTPGVHITCVCIDTIGIHNSICIYVTCENFFTSFKPESIAML